MSATAPASTPDGADEHPQADAACMQCGGALADDQEWCLRCGAARTLIHRTPDWRVPVAVVGIVVVLVLAGVLIALINLSGAGAGNTPSASAPASAGASPSGVTGAGVTGAGATASGATGASPTAPAGAPPPPSSKSASLSPIASWAVGLPGWTAVLASSRSRASAHATARRIAGAGIPVGVLNSTEHPALAPRYWVVFSGRYATDAAARSHAIALVAEGYPSAHARLIGRPGG